MQCYCTGTALNTYTYSTYGVSSRDEVLHGHQVSMVNNTAENRNLWIEDVAKLNYSVGNILNYLLCLLSDSHDAASLLKK